MPLSPGAMLERYEIVRLVGRGGMGEVYQAIDTRLHRPVALKVLREDKDQSMESGTGGVARLIREARAAAALNHPNSVAIYEVGEAAGVAYIAMELVTGESFRRLSKSSHVSIETKLGWLVDAARALWAAHKAGIIHRDIKPSNIMVSEEGIVKVLDFGLAKPYAGAHDPVFQTVMGQVLGTPRYMSPEQIAGTAFDGRADQFAFGLTAYELLCGEYAGGALETSRRPMVEIVREIPPELDRVVARMTMPRPEDRFETMEEVAHALRGCIAAVQARRNALEAGEDMATISAGRAPVSAAAMPLTEGGSTVRLPPLGALSAPPPSGLPSDARPPHTALSSTAPTNRTLPLGQASSPVPPGPPPALAQPFDRAPPSGGAGGAWPASAGVALPSVAAQLEPRRATPWVAIAMVVALVAVGVGGALAFALR